ncbi:hypothetical protein D9601_06530 [Sphingomonas sp. MA1305]|uniref:hypothetical protein n=1 Tax=Sphingomonas sp. MA1305 TaxID=2479204 RepID=UPI0018DFCEEA|nr:hypothetical protein [Sphingomonas sp. MA1305]MBI0475016.1 hypothetical protein [Sphingomonas sp. MA1305]
MEYWVLYDLATGADRVRGSGPIGSAALQSIPPGLGLVLVPAAALLGPELDLVVIRSWVATQIDVAAEQLRQRFLTPGSGQAMTYQRKETEARAWQADQAAVTPFLTAEAAARRMTLEALAAEVVAQADAWTSIGSAIEAARMGAKAGLAQTATLGAIVAASAVDWEAVIAAAVA